MPIYAYKCASCGYAKDVLQKISDAPLTVCPQCGQASFQKQVTAAGFQLKGSGWYVTDFRGGGGAPANKEGAEGKEPAKSGETGGEAKPEAKSDAKSGEAASGAKSESKGQGGGSAAAAPSAPTSTPAPSSSGGAAGGGGSRP